MRARAKLFFLLLAPMAPVVMMVLVLEMYGPSGSPLTDSELQYLRSKMVDFHFGRITYVTVTTLHYFVFAAITYLYWSLCRSAGESTKVVLRYSLWPCCLIAVVFFTLFWLAGEYSLTVHKLSSRNLLDIYGISAKNNGDLCINSIRTFLTEWFPDTCKPWWTFQIASTLPVIPAVVTTTALAAFTNAQVLRFIDAKEYERHRLYFSCRHTILQCLPMTSSLLATGVIASAVWFHLPIAIFGNQWRDTDDETLKSTLQKLQTYGDEMTLLWAMTYTLIVVMVIAWPIWRLTRKGHAVDYAYDAGSDVSGRTTNFLWLTRQVLIVLGPLISGLLFNWLENSL